MRGVWHMIVITLGIVGVLACEGCTSIVADEYISPPKSGQITTAPPSATMMVVAPAPSDRYNSYSQAHAPMTPYEGLKQMETTLQEYGVAIPAPYEAGTITYDGAQTTYMLVSGNPNDATIALTAGFDIDRLSETQWSATPALRALYGQRNAQRLSSNLPLQIERYGAQFEFAAPSEVTGLRFDIGVVPRASYVEDGNFSTRRFGGEIRLGQDIDHRGNSYGLPSWYLFAGADGEAVIFNNGSAGSGLAMINGLQLRDQVTVGDIQAGLNVKRYGTNFALSYIRREVEYEVNDAERIERNEDFGGITLSWRR